MTGSTVALEGHIDVVSPAVWRACPAASPMASPVARRRAGIFLPYLALLGFLLGGSYLVSQLYSSLSERARADRMLETREKLQAASRVFAFSLADRDGDGVIEGTLLDTLPAGGAAIPVTPPDLGGFLGEETVRDGWGRPLGLCLWDHGAATAADAGIPGQIDPADHILAGILSAGPDGVFQTSCPAVFDPAGRLSGDDAGERWSYREMLSLTARISPVDDGRGSVAYLGPGGLGIGRAADSDRLAVAGNIRVSGSLQAGSAVALEGHLDVAGGEAADGELQVSRTSLTGRLLTAQPGHLREIGGNALLIDSAADCEPGNVRVVTGELQLCGPAGWTAGGGMSPGPTPEVTTDFDPDPFSVPSHQAGISGLGAFFASPPITITGIDGPVTATSTASTGGNPVLSINGGPWIQEGTVRPGDTIRFGASAPGDYWMTHWFSAYVGNYSVVWYISTDV